MHQPDLIPHLFRTEFSKIAAVLCKAFGMQHIQAAEDIAAETFLAALENWPYKGIPPDPTAWLYAVAKNKAKTYLRRNQLFSGKIAATLQSSLPQNEEMVIDLSATNITDSQLQMLFALCHPSIPAEAQIGDLILYYDQDVSLWNAELISRGTSFLHRAAKGNKLSAYHLEAAIAYWQTVRDEDDPHKWENVLQLYNQLLRIRYSPVAALNRTYALSKTAGKQKAIQEAEKLQLNSSPFYFALLGELYTGIDNDRARKDFLRAIELARTLGDKQAIQKKLNKLRCQ